MKTKKWKFPKWLEKYLPMLGASTKERVEGYMNCDSKDCNIVVNAPRALVCCQVQTQVNLLIRLHDNACMV